MRFTIHFGGRLEPDENQIVVMDQVLIVAILVGLVAIYPAWLLCQKAFFQSEWRAATVVACLTVPILIVAPFFYLPFWIYQDQEVKPSDMFTDFVLYGACPVLLIALIAYVMDHLNERPQRAVVAGAACLAIAMLPILYYFFADRMFADMGITLLQATTDG